MLVRGHRCPTTDFKYCSYYEDDTDGSGNFTSMKSTKMFVRIGNFIEIIAGQCDGDMVECGPVECDEGEFYQILSGSCQKCTNVNCTDGYYVVNGCSHTSDNKCLSCRTEKNITLPTGGSFVEGCSYRCPDGEYEDDGACVVCSECDDGMYDNG